jgi:hypothetical protein
MTNERMTGGRFSEDAMNDGSHAIPLFAVLGIVLVAGLNACAGTFARAADEMSADVLATHLRLQGYKCDRAQSAERDAKQSRPDEAAWIVTCDTGTYRVQLMPHQAARVERVEAGK